MTETSQTSLLFVCLGNICRSPTAEGVMRHIVDGAGAGERFAIDSAGTGSWHIGESPDRRSVAAAATRGIVVDGAARQVRVDDFDEFDLLLAADRYNLRELLGLAPSEEDRARVRYLREFDPASDGSDLEVPDPYYGGPSGFDDVLDLVDAACRGLYDHCVAQLQPRPQ